jgi:radical SAM protein with 4Fe4S-binding SPASM domain
MSGTISTKAADALLHPLAVNSTEERDFLAKAGEIGWLRNGAFVGTIQEIDTPHHLRRLQIEALTRCNLRCSYCYSESGPQNSLHLSEEELLDLVEQADAMGVYTIDFTGGEFLLHPAWHQALKFSNAKQIATTVHTNGTALTEKNVHILRACEASRVNVAIDSHISSDHDRIRGLDGAFLKTIEGVKRALAAGLKVRVTLMVHKENQHTIGDAPRTLREMLGPNVELAFDRLMPTGGDLTAKMALTAKDYYEATAPLLNRQIALGKLCQSPNPSATLEPHCGVGHSYAYITSGGEIALCPTMSSRDHQSFAGPSIRSTTLREAWLNHPTFQRYRGVQCTNISHCPAASNCRGGCRSNAYFETGDVSAPDVTSCNEQKNHTMRFRDFLQEYRQVQPASVESQ